MRRRTWIGTAAAPVILVLVLGVFVSRPEPESYDAKIMVQVTRNFVDNGSVEVTEDEFGFNTPYSTYGLGFSLLMVPADATAKAMGADRDAAVMLTNPILLAALAAILLGWARLTGASPTQSVFAMAVVLLASMVLPYTATGFSELAVAVAVALSLLGIEGVHQARRWGALVAGTGVGLALLCRTDTLLLVAPFAAAAVWWSGGRQLRPVVQFSVALAPWFAAWAAYNAYRFGAPWRLGYEGYGFTTPFGKGLYGLTVSSGRGVLWHAPLLIVAAVGIRRAYRRAPTVAVAAVGMFLVRPLFFASWSAWEGGVCWGPRFLVPAMPLLAVGVVEIVRGWRRHAIASRFALSSVVVASFGVQVIGTAVAYEAFYGQEVVPRAAQLPNRDVSFHLFGWTDSPIVGEGRYLLRGEALASRFLR